MILSTVYPKFFLYAAVGLGFMGFVGGRLGAVSNALGVLFVILYQRVDLGSVALEATRQVSSVLQDFI